MEHTHAREQESQHSAQQARASARRRQKHQTIILPFLVLTALLLLVILFLGRQLNQRQAELDALRDETDQLRKAAENAETMEAALREEIDRLIQDNADLLARLEAVERDRQSVDDRLAAEAAERRATPSLYSELYPELYAEPADLESAFAERTVYLTFDDGPSARTAEVLDILKENGVQATFFVTGQTSELAQEMMRRIVDEGHTIAIHTYTHDYKVIYASVPAYLEDFDRIYNWVHEVTGVYPQIFRFPGGSINSFNQDIYEELIAEMDRRGFVHYDWNALSGDAEPGSHTAEQLAENALAKVGAQRVILLMHDSVNKEETVACLTAVIAGYRDAGYTFAPLTPEVKAITFD